MTAICPEEAALRASAGSRLTGFLGALLGALVGALPWFLVSTFANLYVGWLGFLVSWVSLAGYRLLHGVKRPGFAVFSIFVCSIASIILAYFSSLVFSLITDADIQDLANAYYNGSTLAAALELLSYRETFTAMLPDLIMPLFIGLLGMLSTRPQILAYTGGGKPVRTVNSTAEAQETASDEVSLPRSFELRRPRSAFFTAVVCLRLFSALALLSLVLFLDDGDITMLLTELVFVPCALGGIYLMLDARNFCLSVNGSVLTLTNWLGSDREFILTDIDHVKTAGSSRAARTQLIGHGGERLCSLDATTQNYPLLLQYLRQNGIAVRG